MTGIYFGDNSSYHFDQDKYAIVFEGMEVLFILKKEHTHRNRPDKIVVDYVKRECHRFFADGYSDVEPFAGMI
jgi:hypothetical protein